MEKKVFPLVHSFFYLSLFMMMDLSDIITKEDSLAWATTTLYICEAAAAATALHGWFFSGEPIVTGVGGGSSTKKAK